MTANEAARGSNMPAIGGDADELVTPLNVLVGGQASPRDSAPQKRTVGRRRRRRCRSRPGRPTATTEGRRVLREVLRADRAAVVLSRLGAGRRTGGTRSGGTRNSPTTCSPLALSLIAATIGTGRSRGARLDPRRRLQRPRRRSTSCAQSPSGMRRTINATTKDQLDATRAGDPRPGGRVRRRRRISARGRSRRRRSRSRPGSAPIEAAHQIASRNNVTPTKTWVTGAKPATSSRRAERRDGPDRRAVLEWPEVARRRARRTRRRAATALRHQHPLSPRRADREDQDHAGPDQGRPGRRARRTASSRPTPPCSETRTPMATS